MRKILLALLGCMLMIIISSVVYVLYLYDPNPKACQTLISIAQNEEKIEYLEKWLTENIGNPKFMKMFDSSNYMYPDDDRIAFRNTIRIDWHYLGIDDRFASIRLNKTPHGEERNLQTESINSISFGFARDMLIIKIGKSRKTASYRAERNPNRVTVINNKVSVYCADGI